MDSLKDYFRGLESQPITRQDLPGLSLAEVKASASDEDKLKLIVSALLKPLNQLTRISAESLPDIERLPHQDWQLAPGSQFTSKTTGERLYYHAWRPSTISRYLEAKDDHGRLCQYRYGEQIAAANDSGRSAWPAHHLVEHAYSYAPETTERLLVAASVKSYTALEAETDHQFSQDLDAYWFQPAHLMVGDGHYQTYDLVKHSSERLSAHYLDGQLTRVDWYQHDSTQAAKPRLDDMSSPATKDRQIISALLANNQIMEASILERASGYRAEAKLESLGLRRGSDSQLKLIDPNLLANKFVWLDDAPTV